MASKTCREHAASVAEALVLSGRRDPRYDLDGKLSRLLSKQIKGYETDDPAKQQQQCLPVGLIEQFCEQKSNDKARQALQQNYLFAFFFAMRACEFLKVQGKERKTVCIRLNGIIFIKENKILPPTAPNINEADKVAVHFEDQKNSDRNCIRHAAKTSRQNLCPVRAAAQIVRRLQALQAKQDDFIYLYKNNKGEIKELSDNMSLIALREYVNNIPERDALGLRPNKIGNRTLRSSAAMAMKLNQAADSDIMLHGRWKSNAFLDYIRPQTAEFATRMSELMIGTPAIMFSTTNADTFNKQYNTNQVQAQVQEQNQNQMFTATTDNLENILAPTGQVLGEVCTITATW
jgi:hypothetical protein